MLKLMAASFILSVVFSSCISNDTGTNTLIKESINQAQTKKATLFLKEGDATVDDSYQVTVANADHKFNKSEVGNVFTVDANHGHTWLKPNSINFTWLGNDTLQIDYDKKLRTFVQENKIDGIVVVYKSR